MKTKLAIVLALGIFAGGLSSLMAGGKGGVVIHTGGSYCPPVRAICAAPIYSTPIYRSYPTSCLTPQPTFYSWGPSVVVYSSAPSYGFSPLLNYPGSAPVYQIAPPVVPAPPLVVGPTSVFSWRH